ncbi:MAG TPA: LD-carboxypeptidase [Kofleriaceae bacterium]|nr:LD-carboxypeptidase [Kofleriaceae bacterium]
MIVPPRITKGQTIGIVAPAGPVKLERLRLGLACLGDAFELRIAASVTGPRAPDIPSYLAAPDEVRIAELTAMLADPDVRAIIFARGGYGVMRILPHLDPQLLRRDPKPIVGFSDATAMLAWAYRAGVRGIHGPMIAQLSDLPPSDIAHLIALLTEPRPLGERAWPLRSHGHGRHRGSLVPANLTLASLLVGTPWSLPLAGAIALFEEVGERPYEIDRYLTQLALTGALSSTAAAVIGDLTRCYDPSPPSGERDPDDAALAVMLERLRAAGTPVAVGAPVGHGKRNEAVPFGAMCELDLDLGAFAITEPAVA